jgi:hypothetical protein
MTLI